MTHSLSCGIFSSDIFTLIFTPMDFAVTEVHSKGASAHVDLFGDMAIKFVTCPTIRPNHTVTSHRRHSV